jgi:hypothetical protein
VCANDYVGRTLGGLINFCISGWFHVLFVTTAAPVIDALGHLFTRPGIHDTLHAFVSHLVGVLHDQAMDESGLHSGDQIGRRIEPDELDLPRQLATLEGLEDAGRT